MKFFPRFTVIGSFTGRRQNLGPLLPVVTGAGTSRNCSKTAWERQRALTGVWRGSYYGCGCAASKFGLAQEKRSDECS